MTDWQPIETAPKDGADFLVYFPCDIEVGWSAVVCQATWINDRIGFSFSTEGDYRLDDGIDPTHWMPLPKPPESKK